MTDGKSTFAKLKKNMFCPSFLILKIKKWITNIVDPDEAAHNEPPHNEPPHMNLRCLQVSTIFFHFGGLK